VTEIKFTIKKGVLVFALVMFVGISDASAQVNCGTSITPLSFGTYRPFLESDTNSVASITLNCSGTKGATIPYEIRLSTGQSGDIYNRALIAGDAQSDLFYQLYTDPAYSVVWGDGITGTSGSGVISLVAPNGVSTKNIYGRIPKKQTVKSGRYSDYIVVSVIF